MGGASTDGRPHQKLIVVDGLVAFKGSANLTLNGLLDKSAIGGFAYSTGLSVISAARLPAFTEKFRMPGGDGRVLSVDRL
jgi:Phospholipase D Active site motif